ncbi:DUF1376 domain-containing protein [Salipiger bermudensis]|uniref:DUF1376 domain-containing protein n=1 Tax=Salipiger bermudensis TaxID=344736 RepID=UPI001A8C4AAC|nr:DUF1376 domain-containing protein [Salipiger bermudensis]MBN9674628.1 DUF1376 domain-containing protein [Salipiger bermudensis]
METTTVSDTWWYPLRYGDTLSNHDWIPLYINRLLTSRFVAHAIAEGRRADLGTALLLWAESFKQDPAGTLPDDDIQLAQIARFGADLDGWRAARAGALYGWRSAEIEGEEPGRTARLAHPVIAEIAFDMHKRKKGRDQARAASRMSSLRSRVRAKLHSMKYPKHIWDSRQIVETVADFLDQAGLYCTDENLRIAMADAVGIPREVTTLRSAGGADGDL